MSEQHNDEKLQDLIYRGQMARDLLDNPIYKESWESTERDLLEAIVLTPQRDKAGREELVTMVKLLRKVRSGWEGAILTGKNASLTLQGRKTWKERMTEWSL